MADLTARSILPDGSRNFTFSTVTQPESREKHKNYVFVDEHNRHRRLKVMRACAACRRRKIKCDAATTNTWPCAPCVKQQLECVPPSSDKDGQDVSLEDQRQNAFATYPTAIPSTSPPNVTTYQQQINVPPAYSYASSLPSATSEHFQGSIAGSDIQHSAFGHDSITPVTPQEVLGPGFQPQSIQKSPTTASVSAATHHSDSQDSELANVLQDLKIDQGGVAPYIANQQTALADGPPVEEPEAILPLQMYPNSAARIPSEMWPPDQQAKQYFDYFFNNIHPYVPVVNRSSFFQLWQVDRSTISPLILEGIFACSAHALGHSEERGRWLALATRHEECFRDVPRLGTIQGLILILKARESTPKRGYYYRSWMTIQYMISMAKDLGLDQHNKMHAQGQPCGSDVFDCTLKSRIWHVLFQMEMMVGGPQGRYNFAVDINTVNVNPPSNLPGMDYSELKISQDQTYFVQLVYNIRRTAALYVQIKAAGGECATDRAFIKHNEDYARFEDGLPPHLQVKYPEDGSPPSIPFHFVANLQCYQLLGVIMHHRPQLEGRQQNYDDGSWKDIMITCYSAATKICRLHEAIMQNFGLKGFLCMVRGINTTIYTVLSCTMLHLVALTSPDPELNNGARDYFGRHMRILERCSSSWPVPQVQMQIDSLRQAFSADLNQPFELRPDFPFASPSPDPHPASPPADSGYLSAESGHRQAMSHHNWSNSFDGTPVTPPQGTSIRTPQDMISTTSFSGPHSGYVTGGTMGWDPSSIMDKWQTAFNPVNMETPSPGLSGPSMHSSTAPTSAPVYSNPQHAGYFNEQGNIPANPALSPTYPSNMSAQQAAYLGQATVTSPTFGPGMHQSFVTPSMWQDTVAQSYGSKRRWDGDSSGHNYKRPR